MPMVRAMRLLNAAEAGTLSGAQLEALLASDPGRLAELNVLLGMRGQARRMAASSTAVANLMDSPIAASYVAYNAVAYGAILESRIAMTAVAAAANRVAAMAADPDALGAMVASPIARDAIAASSAAKAQMAAQGASRLAVVSRTGADESFVADCVRPHLLAYLDDLTWPARTHPTAKNTIAFGNGVFVSVANTSVAYTSTDGRNWTQRTIAASGTFPNVVFANGRFFTSNSETIHSSTDGVTWTSGVAAVAVAKVAFGAGLFVILRQSGANTSYVTSAGGLAFTTRTLPAPSPNAWESIAFGNGVFVVMQNGSSSFITSTDGINWTSRTAPFSTSPSLIFANGLFVAYGGSGAPLWTSTDGITWTQRTASTGWTDVCYASDLGRFFAVKSQAAIMSTDGITWTDYSKGSSFPVGTNRIVYGNNILMPHYASNAAYAIGY